MVAGTPIACELMPFDGTYSLYVPCASTVFVMFLDIRRDVANAREHQRT